MTRGEPNFMKEKEAHWRCKWGIELIVSFCLGTYFIFLLLFSFIFIGVYKYFIYIYILGVYEIETFDSLEILF